MRILVSMADNHIRKTFISEEGKQYLESLGEVVWNEKNENYSKEEFSQIIKDFDILIIGWMHEKIDSKMVKDAEKLKLIVHTGGTVGPVIDKSIYEETDIKVISGNYYFAESVAEGVLAYMLMALRKLDYYSANLKQGNWLDGEDCTTEGLLDQTVGIISLGTISKILIQMAKPFRVRFLVYSTNQDTDLEKEMGFKYASREEIFKNCKIISVHTASNPQTVNFIDGKLFKLIGDNAIFINTSRGPVVNDEDLIEELKKGKFRAVLDVFDEEPLSKTSPYLSLDNVTLYPHMAGPTMDRRAMIFKFLADDIKAFTEGGKLENEITYDMAKKMTQTK